MVVGGDGSSCPATASKSVLMVIGGGGSSRPATASKSVLVQLRSVSLVTFVVVEGGGRGDGRVWW